VLRVLYRCIRLVHQLSDLIRRQLGHLAGLSGGGRLARSNVAAKHQGHDSMAHVPVDAGMCRMTHRGCAVGHGLVAARRGVLHSGADW
jgi:hypothetical protein